VDRKTYEEVKRGLRAVQDGIETSKRPAYTVGSADVLANFKRVAERSGISPLQCILVYFLKHIDSIQSIVSPPKGTITQAEPIVERFADASNYLNLMLALLIEEHEEWGIMNSLIKENADDRNKHGNP